MPIAGDDNGRTRKRLSMHGVVHRTAVGDMHLCALVGHASFNDNQGGDFVVVEINFFLTCGE